MCARRQDHRTLPRRRGRRRSSGIDERDAHLMKVRADFGRSLDLAREHLRFDMSTCLIRESAGRQRRTTDQAERLALHEVVLLLDAERASDWLAHFAAYPGPGPTSV